MIEDMGKRPRASTWNQRYDKAKQEKKVLDHALKLAKNDSLKAALKYLKLVSPAQVTQLAQQSCSFCCVLWVRTIPRVIPRPACACACRPCRTRWLGSSTPTIRTLSNSIHTMLNTQFRAHPPINTHTHTHRLDREDVGDILGNL